MLLEKIINTTDVDANLQVNHHLANGWYIDYIGLTIIIMKKEFDNGY